MIKDYAASYSMGAGIANHRQRISAKSPGVATHSLMMRTIGVMVALTLTAGVTSTIVYGMQIRSALDQIGSRSEVRSGLVEQNRELSIARDKLMTIESIKKAASRLGLFPPTPDQIRGQ